MPRYLIRALRQLQVSDSTRQPGELVPEAAEWPNLRHYESLSWVERVPVPNDYSGEGAVEYPPAAPTSKLAEVLERMSRVPWNFGGGPGDLRPLPPPPDPCTDR
jgi:hypothetical protein